MNFKQYQHDRDQRTTRMLKVLPYWDEGIETKMFNIETQYSRKVHT